MVATFAWNALNRLTSGWEVHQQTYLQSLCTVYASPQRLQIFLRRFPDAVCLLNFGISFPNFGYIALPIGLSMSKLRAGSREMYGKNGGLNTVKGTRSDDRKERNEVLV